MQTVPVQLSETSVPWLRALDHQQCFSEINTRQGRSFKQQIGGLQIVNACNWSEERLAMLAHRDNGDGKTFLYSMLKAVGHPRAEGINGSIVEWNQCAIDVLVQIPYNQAIRVAQPGCCEVHGRACEIHVSQLYLGWQASCALQAFGQTHWGITRSTQMVVTE